MKLKCFVFTISCLFIFTSCIKDEALNSEADIESFTLPDEIVWDIIGIKGKDSNISLLLKSADTKIITPQIKVTEGATLTPASGEPIDISAPVTYTVVSEDKRYTRTFVVKAIPFSLKYDFEDWDMVGAPYSYPAMADNMWSSANSGIALAKVGKVDEYPTHSTEDSYKGKYAAMLQTQKGGKYWNNLIPVFSGSLFRGAFQINMGNFVKSTKFGQLHPKELGKPIEFNGHYKYEAGSPFYDEKDNIVPGKIDECSIYSVLYKVTKGVVGTKDDEFLDGLNIMSSDKVIARAQLEDGTNKGSYTEFGLKFKYTEEPDYDRFDYKLAVVFASSKEGDFYRGGIGSTLIIDEVEVICEPYK